MANNNAGFDETIPQEFGDRDTMLQQVLAYGGGPAFVSRALETHQAWVALLERCRAQREEWLAMVRTRLGVLAGMAGDWDALRPWLADGPREALRRLHEELKPQLRVPVARTTSRRLLAAALAELKESIDRFNAKWRDYLTSLDLEPVNRLRENYNKYYVIEKECLVRSPALARRGFVPLPPVTRDDVAAIFPPLPELPAA